MIGRPKSPRPTRGNYGVDPNAENEIHLLTTGGRSGTALVGDWAGGAGDHAAVVYMAQKPDIYQAEARVQVDLESNAMVGRTLTLWARLTIPSFNTQLQILTSSGLFRRVVKTLDLNTILTLQRAEETAVSVADCETNGGPQRQRKDEEFTHPNDELTLTPGAAAEH